jgi:hypothetical protein
VDRDVIAADGSVRLSDTRNFPTSLDPDRITAADPLAAVRAHWRIENSLFFLHSWTFANQTNRNSANTW